MKRKSGYNPSALSSIANFMLSLAQRDCGMVECDSGMINMFRLLCDESNLKEYTSLKEGDKICMSHVFGLIQYYLEWLPFAITKEVQINKSK